MDSHTIHPVLFRDNRTCYSSIKKKNIDSTELLDIFINSGLYISNSENRDITLKKVFSSIAKSELTLINSLGPGEDELEILKKVITLGEGSILKGMATLLDLIPESLLNKEMTFKTYSMKKITNLRKPQ